MEYKIQGKGSIKLGPKDFICQGGEGSVYAKGATAYKLYSDPKKMLAVGKIQELAVLTHPNIIKPEDILNDDNGKPVGYTMKYVKDTHALCQLFTKSFRDRNNVTPAMSLALVRDLQVLVKHVHDKKILIVDLNEMNFLVSQDFKSVYSIDVDSFQTKSFPATALMESVRDRHSSKFSEGTDWFAFAIVSFQLLIGIHPYKGKHSTYHGFDERMKHNVSVLNSSVSVPAVCPPFTVIPPIYMEWYKAVLERGARIAPPADLVATVALVTTVKQLTGSDHFDIEELEMFSKNIINIFYSHGVRIAQTQQELHANKDHVPLTRVGVVATTPRHNLPVHASIEYGRIKIFNMATRKELPVDFPASQVMQYDNRLYFKSDSSIMEAKWMNETQDGSSLMFTWNQVANIAEKSTQMFSGVAFQNLLGALWISIFPEAGSHVQIRFKELDEHKIVDARYERGVLMIIAARKGKYDKYVCRISDDSTYDMRIVKDIVPADLNFVVLDSGVCVHINEDDAVELFSSKKNSAAMTVIQDKEISGDMRLFRNGTKVLFARATKLFSMTMKKKS
jgi:serine/threonine protein kinase